MRVAQSSSTFACSGVEPAKISELLGALYAYRGLPASEATLKLAPLFFVRPIELRKAEWLEFDFAGA
jgi:hypothetical protein